MINRLQKKYALSVQGAKDLFKAIVYSVLANISLMLPVALLAKAVASSSKIIGASFRIARANAIR